MTLPHLEETMHETVFNHEPLNSIGVDTILFDYGGVVGIHRVQPYWNRLASMLNSDPAILSEFISETSPHGIAFRSGYLTMEEFWGQVQRLVGVQGRDPKILMDTWARSYVVDPRMVDLSGKLRARGYRTGILMNSDAERYKYIHDTYNIEDRFDYIIASNIFRVTKPEPAAYEMAKKIADKIDNPSSMLFIDDKELNVKMAVRQGLQGLTFTGYEDLVGWFIDKGILPRGQPDMKNKGSLSIDEEQVLSRSDYITAISGIIPLDELEVQDIQHTLAWLHTAPAIHKPENTDEHLGVLCFIISPDRKKTFLLNHRKSQMWLPPGGHVDQGFTFSETVSLEVKEELGVEPQFIQAFPFFLTRTSTRGLSAEHVDVTAWYILEGDPLQQYSIYLKEASEARWIDIEDLLNFPEESHLPRATRKLLTLLHSSM